LPQALSQAVTLHRQGSLAEAEQVYRGILADKPDHFDALHLLGVVRHQRGEQAEALELIRAALRLRPSSVDALVNHAAVLRSLNRVAEALESYESALALRPDYAEAKFAACMAQLPILYTDEAEIAVRRAAYERHLRALCDDVARGRASGNLVQAVGSSQPFYLAYQGLNDRELQSLYGAMVCRIMGSRYPPPLPAEPPRPGEPVKVGIVSGFFRLHSNWKIPIKGWLTQLDRRKFRLFGYHTGAQRDAETDIAAALCERFVQGLPSIDRWREEILADAPHVLIYPEIGMDPLCAALAAQRLAAVQCNSWGHPSTSGYPTVDYYLSSDLMEPADAQDHYTERLIRLPNLSVYYEPLAVEPVSISRADLGLRASATVYWCAQSLFKYLPQFDQVFARVARQVGDCQFVFVAFRRGAEITDLFRRRLDRAFADVGLRASDHCVFIPLLEPQWYVAATGRADIVLDSIGWSGCNSILETLPHDLPIVAMQGTLMRGRHGAAILARMGVTETVAETIDDYVFIAARLARDTTWRRAVTARVAAGKQRLYRDGACISALEAFLDRAARGPAP
jgi:predicted O-linked N-acetylglucosamine transferase (SPINDLY family)